LELEEGKGFLQFLGRFQGRNWGFPWAINRYLGILKRLPTFFLVQPDYLLKG